MQYMTTVCQHCNIRHFWICTPVKRSVNGVFSRVDLFMCLIDIHCGTHEYHKELYMQLKNGIDYFTVCIIWWNKCITLCTTILCTNYCIRSIKYTGSLGDNSEANMFSNLILPFNCLLYFAWFPK